MDKKEFMESAFYGLAAYTFYGFTAAIISFIKYRSRSNPVYATVKRIQLAKAIVSMFTTQVALITRFSGTDMNSSGFDAGVMNTLTGVAVTLAVNTIAAVMLAGGLRDYKELKANGE